MDGVELLQGTRVATSVLEKNGSQCRAQARACSTRMSSGERHGTGESMSMASCADNDHEGVPATGQRAHGQMPFGLEK